MKIKKYFFITIIVCFIVIPLVVNCAFQHEAPVDILAARWEASDALSYIATILSFMGTVFLGLVACKQNDDLQKIETNTFISNNKCEVFLKSIQLKNLGQKQVNLHIKHDECIVEEEGIHDNDTGLQIEICLERKMGYPILVRVNDMQIFVGKETDADSIKTKRYDDKFSKIAIEKDCNKFNVTVLLNLQTQTEITDKLKDDCEIIIDMNIELVSAGYVSTKVKCRGEFIKSKDENSEISDLWSANKTMCFWDGCIIYSQKEVTERIVG